MKKTPSVMLAIALVLVCGLASADALKIGVIGPMTGPAADYGLACQRGAIIAANEINAAAGETVIELLIEDDEHNAEKSVNAYHTVLDNGAQMIAGTTTTTPCIAVGAEAYSDRVFMLTPSASSTAVTEDKDNVYQVCFTDPAQGTASAQYIKENNLGTKIAVIYNNADAYSTGIYQTFVAEAATQGLEIVATSTFTDDTTDFSVQVTEAQKAGADLVFLPIYYTPASMILQQAKGMDYAPIFFGVDGMDGILSIEGFDQSLAEGVMLLTPFAADATDEMTVNFVTAYNAEFGVTPSQFAADNYDAVYALYNASKNAGIDASTSAEDACEKLIEQFKSLEFTGLTGTMSWNEDGSVTKTPKAVVIKGGVYVSPENL
ncbi:MAG: ABC transporter substrate-binding protein [Clostridia bacterium]|nr:ABC transporter substrate-binding protein [Clostridia bacterium]